MTSVAVNHEAHTYFDSIKLQLGQRFSTHKLTHPEAFTHKKPSTNNPLLHRAGYAQLPSVPHGSTQKPNSLRKWCLCAAAVVIFSRLAPLYAQTATPDKPVANPARPTVTTPATLTPVGYLQFENGFIYADTSPVVEQQFGLNQVTKLTVAPRLEFLGVFEPYVYSSRVVGDGLSGRPARNPRGGCSGSRLPGRGRKTHHQPELHPDLYAGNAPDLDIGSTTQSALLLWSEDIAGFHFDLNDIFGEETQDKLRRAQFGQALSVSHPLGPFVADGELWHFTQPLTGGNAVGTLWSLSYTARKNLVFDAGFDHGVTSSSTQWEGFAGFTYLLPHRLWKQRDKPPNKSASAY